jgi:autotransporter adhesin
MRRIDRINRRKARLALTLLAFGVVSVGAVAGSTAAWTDSTSNAGNSIAGGTLAMTNDKDAAAVFSASTIKPGDTGSGTVIVSNTGSVSMGVKLTQDTWSNGFAASMLQLKIHDDTRDWCYWPTTGAGPCGSWGDWDARSTLSGLDIANTAGTQYWPASEAHTFTVSWRLDTTSTNVDQGKTASFRLLWDGSS